MDHGSAFSAGVMIMSKCVIDNSLRETNHESHYIIMLKYTPLQALWMLRVSWDPASVYTKNVAG